MKGTKRVILPVIMALALLIGMQSTSHAATSMELSLWDLVNAPIVVLDNGTGDFDPTVGSVTFIGPIGNWNVNVTTGVTYPALGTTDTPKMDLNSVNVSSSDPATLLLGVSALGYTLAPGGAIFQIGGTTAGFVSAEAFSGDIGSYFDTANSLGGPMIFSFGAFSGSVNGVVPTSPNPYSLTILAQIDHAGSGSTSFDASLAVPEPATLLLLGFGLVGLVGVRRKLQE